MSFLPSSNSFADFLSLGTSRAIGRGIGGGPSGSTAGASPRSALGGAAGAGVGGVSIRSDALPSAAREGPREASPRPMGAAGRAGSRSTIEYTSEVGVPAGAGYI